VLSISVVPVGLTKHHKYGHRPHTREEAIATVAQVEAWQREFLHTLGTRFVFATDEWYLVAGKPIPSKRAYEHHALQANGLGMVRDFLDEWRSVKNRELRMQNAEGAISQFTIHHSQYKSALLATGTLFAPALAKAAKEFTHETGFPLHVLPIVNERLGDTITVAGLLSGEDIIRQLKARTDMLNNAGIVILPRIAFDHPDGIALDDVSPLDIARAINKPVALADWMGDVVDALTGRNKLTFAPDAGVLDVPIIREGGWAVEKYL
jgi:NifB/MoaA-like Fe-S oxidoreductase